MGIEELKGKTLTRAALIGDDRIEFDCDDGTAYALFHMQDCCEGVTVESIVGELADLVGSPILEAEDVNSEGYPPPPSDPESYTWTFYKLGTIKGGVTIRWLGESNGYYSEEVDFRKV